jgi:hypothetical protein
MPLISTNQTETKRVEGAEHGGTISLILDFTGGTGPRLR